MNARPPVGRLRVVLFEGKGSRPLPAERVLALTRAVLEAGLALTRVRGDGAVAPLDDSDHVFLGAFEELPTAGDARFIDVAHGDVEAIVGRVIECAEDARAKPRGWKPWFPVIDFDRCTNCMQCLTFCLFDVYGVDEEDRISVQHASSCKTDCPACSRVCPEAAILFPKYRNGPINGDVVRDEDLRREAMKVDISALLGGDLYGALRRRQSEARTRFSTERDESKALLERKRCLKKLGEDLDIPDEVLMTLPSAGDIEERARRAREKAERRRRRSQSVRDDARPSEDDWGI